MRRFSTIYILPILAGCLLLSSGCGDSRRQAVEGTVTLDGKPMKEGYLRFVPQPGTSGPTAGAPIQDGRFVIPCEGSVFSGTFRVEITARRAAGKQTLDPESGTMMDAYEQFIPARFNSKSELTAQVKEGETNHFEFAVTSEPK